MGESQLKCLINREYAVLEDPGRHGTALNFAIQGRSRNPRASAGLTGSYGGQQPYT